MPVARTMAALEEEVAADWAARSLSGGVVCRDEQAEVSSTAQAQIHRFKDTVHPSLGLDVRGREFVGGNRTICRDLTNRGGRHGGVKL